ncbi:MAG TPA: hypothetical protein VGM90_32495 [Kofleriaceae bacterium]|jgi:hypothetical protein
MKPVAFVPVAVLVFAGCVSSNEAARRTYDADYQLALANCGHDQTALETGYNAGRAGQKMNSAWANLCVPDVRQQSTAAYQNGFLNGARSAPIRVVHTNVFSKHREPLVATCTFDSDCGDGFHCRDKECMGFGETGERCVFNDDCANDHCFGGTCRE